MLARLSARKPIPVVPRKGDVDRNACALLAVPGSIVVPRKGDVDRNIQGHSDPVQKACVVPRKGDVDRNART